MIMQSLSLYTLVILQLAFFHGATAYSNVYKNTESSILPVSSSFVRQSKIISSHEASALNDSRTQKRETSRMQKRVTYGLGLGLNAPIKPVGPANHIAAHRVGETAAGVRTVEFELDPARYLVEYEAVRPYPQPTREADPMKKKKKSRPIIPKRLVGDDVLRIETSSSEKEPTTEPLAVQQMVAFAQTRQIDPNTAWVEMLISEQQLRYAGIQQYA